MDKKITVALIVLGIILSLGIAGARMSPGFARIGWDPVGMMGSAFAPAFSGFSGMMGGGMMGYGQGYNTMMGGGMMEPGQGYNTMMGSGMMEAGQGYNPGGGGMMGYGQGYNTMMGGGMGYGGMGGMGCGGYWDNQRVPSNATLLTLDQAVEAAQKYLNSLGNQDLALTEVMEFSNNFYAEVKEKSTGIHAFELLNNKYDGTAYPEPGPNMMWNTKYGHMGGMMLWWNGEAPAMTVTPDQAKTYAQNFLDANLPGTKVEEADTFYGYYTLHVLKDSQIQGMLSVNGYTGDVWYHTWHGTFLGEKELD